MQIPPCSRKRIFVLIWMQPIFKNIAFLDLPYFKKRVAHLYLNALNFGFQTIINSKKLLYPETLNLILLFQKCFVPAEM